MFSDEIITVGGLRMTKGAFITLISGFVLSVFLAFFVPRGIYAGPFVFLTFVLAAYNINCAVVGNCKIWALVCTLFWVFYVVLVIFTAYTSKDKLIKFVKSKK
jgi:hypothetical protein